MSLHVHCPPPREWGTAAPNRIAFHAGSVTRTDGQTKRLLFACCPTGQSVRHSIGLPRSPTMRSAAEVWSPPPPLNSDSSSLLAFPVPVRPAPSSEQWSSWTGENPVQAPVTARRLNKGTPVTNVVQKHGPDLEVGHRRSRDTRLILL